MFCVCFACSCFLMFCLFSLLGCCVCELLCDDLCCFMRLFVFEFVFSVSVRFVCDSWCDVVWSVFLLCCVIVCCCRFLKNVC